MKIGQKLPVQIEGMTVGEAYVDDIDGDEAIVIIPATRLVVKVRTSLDFAAEAERESDGTERVLVGTVDNDGNVTSPAVDDANNTSGTGGQTEAAKPAESNSGPSTTAPEPVQNVGSGIHGKDLDSSALD